MQNGLFRFVLKITKHVKLADLRNTKFRETASLFRETTKPFFASSFAKQKAKRVSLETIAERDAGIEQSPELLYCSVV
jgi:hypothetical protein